jgi:bacillithiol biosynthesis deacetylase BshB1
MKLDILAFGAHPDDIELAASGTLLHHRGLGQKIGVIDLTQGELGTRGNAALRLQEAEKAAQILGLSARENLGMADGFFEINENNLLKVVEMIRKYRPEVVFANAVSDRHPDHGRGAELVSRACFLSGLVKVETNQQPWRPKTFYNYIQDRGLTPNFVVDITPYWPKKLESIMAYSSQFYDPKSKEPASPISSKEFKDFLEARAREYGRMIGVEFGEGFTSERPIGIDSVLNLK